MTALVRGVRTDTKVPVVRLPLDACTTRGGVGEQDGDALLGGGTEEAPFLSTVGQSVNYGPTGRPGLYLRVILRAGQAREIGENGNLALRRIGREEEVELRVETTKD